MWIRTTVLLIGLLWLGGCEGDDPVGPGADNQEDPTPPSSGRLWHVPDDAATIGAALAGAAAGDTVRIAAGTYAEHDLVLPGGVLVQGSGTVEEPTIIDAGGQGRIFTIMDADSLVVLENLVLTGGRIDHQDDGGGAIRCGHSRLDLRGCVVTANEAVGGAGGGLVASYSDLRVTDCRFEGNASGQDGGAIRVDFFSTFTLASTTVVGNAARRGCGGVDAVGSVVAQGCMFMANDGGGLNAGSSARITRTVFRDNVGTGLTTRADTWVDDCLFADNGPLTRGSGGGLNCLGGAVVSRSVFLRNSAPASGGAVAASGGTITLIDCDLIDNIAGDEGGGVAADSLQADRCLLQGNVADQGGAIQSFFCELNDCDFVGNRASSAAALRATAAALDRCTLVGNVAGWSLVHCYQPSSLERCTVADNTINDMDEWAGVLRFYLDGSTVTDCILAFNAGPLMSTLQDVPEFTATVLFGNTGGDWVAGWAEQATLRGNLASDPLFCDLATGDVMLCADSPCLPGASGLEGLIGARDQGCTPCGE